MAGVYSVTQVNSYIKNMFAQDFLLRRLSVKGEVSNCKYHSSGHIYFTLKDGGGTLQAVMFASQRRGLNFKLAEGQQVVVKGTVDVYERDGKYQLYASEIELSGRGDLYLRFEKLLKELEEMGMFDPQYKRPIPRFAKTVGIVTAPTGAAIRDIMNIAHRRNPYVQLILYPALVQGDGAKDSIVKGIRTLDAMGLDVLIVGRGGGSIEDLWAFNEEEVARAIFACNTPVISAVDLIIIGRGGGAIEDLWAFNEEVVARNIAASRIPVISAVGHETDVTIADCAADLRAPTPSAAAELAVFDYFQFQMDLNARKQRLMKEMATCLDRTKNRLRQDMLTLRFYDPKSQLNEKKKRLADAEDTLLRLIAQRQQEARRDLQNAETLLQREMKDRLAADKRNLAVKSARLWGLSPLKKISDGFGFITDGDGKRLETVEQAVPGSRITVRVKDGRIGATVNNVENYDIRTSGQEKLSQ